MRVLFLFFVFISWIFAEGILEIKDENGRRIDKINLSKNYNSSQNIVESNALAKELKAKNAQLENEIEELKEQNLALKTELENSKNENKKASNDVARLSSELSSKEQEISTISAQLDEKGLEFWYGAGAGLLLAFVIAGIIKLSLAKNDIDDFYGIEEAQNKAKNTAKYSYIDKIAKIYEGYGYKVIYTDYSSNIHLEALRDTELVLISCKNIEEEIKESLIIAFLQDCKKNEKRYANKDISKIFISNSALNDKAYQFIHSHSKELEFLQIPANA